MPRVKITLNDGSTKIVKLEDGFNDNDVEEVASILNSQLKQQPKPQQQKKGLDLTPSGLTRNVGNTIGNALASPIISMRDNIPLDQAYQQAQENTQRFNAEEENNPLRKTSDFLTDMAVYSKLPMFNGFKGANAVNGLYQGGLIGGLEGLKEGQNPVTSALGGGAFGAGLNMALPPVLRGATSGINKIASSPAMQNVSSKVKDLLANSIPYLKPETVRQAVKPNSVALDLNENTAQNLLMNTTENVRNAYNQVLRDKGQAVNDAIEKLRSNDFRTSVDDLANDITSTFDQYQGELVNPARNMTGNLETELQNLVESGKSNAKIDTTPTELPTNFLADKKEQAYQILANATGKPINWIKSQIAGGGRSANIFKGIAKRAENIENNAVQSGDKISGLQDAVNANEYPYYIAPGTDLGDASISEGIIQKAYDDAITNNFFEMPNQTEVFLNNLDNKYKQILPNVLNNPRDAKAYENAYSELMKLTEGLPEDLQATYLERLGNDLEQIEKYQNTVSPIDLQKIKQQLGHMVNWGDETAKNYKNPILEQLYGKFTDRLSKMSPELAQANKEFSNLSNFKKNEGLKGILKAGDNIDNASSKLKNYNSTITKGNNNRNITDLENVLVNEGYEPFLNKIDDVNAAQDLLSTPATGINPFGLTNMMKRLTNPALKAVRGYNRMKGNFNPQFKDLPESVKRLLNIGAGMNASMLYGGISNDDMPY